MSNIRTAVTAAQQDGHAEGMACIPLGMLEALVDMARSHVEDIESGIEEGIYLAEENPDIASNRAHVDAAEALYRSVAGDTAMMDRAIIESVMMQDLVGDYDTPDSVLEWDWVVRNASFTHVRNGEAGIWEFVLNLSRTFQDAPAKLAPVIDKAREKGVAYLLFHQGT